MSEFTVDVHTEIPRDQFKVLHAAAAKNKTTVGALVAELVRRGLTPGGAPAATRKPKRGKPTEETRRQLVEMYNAGVTDRDIAERIGMSPAWVGYERKNLGLPTKRPKQEAS